MASVVGGGDLLRFFLVLDLLPFDRSSTKLRAGDDDWRRRLAASSPLSSPGVPCALSSQTKTQIRSSKSTLWSSFSFCSLCSSLMETNPVGSSRRSGVVVSDGLVVCWKSKWRVCGWVFWYEQDGGVMPTMMVRGWVFCSSFSFLFVVVLATGVGSGWAISLLFVCIGLLYGFSRWCHVRLLGLCFSTGVGSGLLFFSTGVGSGLLLDYSQCLVACFVVPHGRSLGWCLSSTPRGVFFIVPSGAFKPLILVSTQDNSRWAPYHDGPTLDVYIITVSVVVFLTLTTFYHIV